MTLGQDLEPSFPDYILRSPHLRSLIRHDAAHPLVAMFHESLRWVTQRNHHLPRYVRSFELARYLAGSFPAKVSHVSPRSFAIRHTPVAELPMDAAKPSWGRDRNPNLGHDFHFQTRETFPQWTKLGLTNHGWVTVLACSLEDQSEERMVYLYVYLHVPEMTLWRTHVPSAIALRRQWWTGDRAWFHGCGRQIGYEITSHTMAQRMKRTWSILGTSIQDIPGLRYQSSFGPHEAHRNKEIMLRTHGAE